MTEGFARAGADGPNHPEQSSDPGIPAEPGARTSSAYPAEPGVPSYPRSRAPGYPAAGRTG